MVALPFGKPHHLVLDRRTVARADSGDLAVVQGRPAEVLADQRVNPLVGEELMAGDLVACQASREERERDDRVVARPRP